MASFSPCKSCHCLNMINECFFKWKLIISVIKITWPRALDCRSCNYLIKIKVTTKQHYQGEVAADLSCHTNVVNQMDQNMFDTEPKKCHIIMISVVPLKMNEIQESFRNCTICLEFFFFYHIVQLYWKKPGVPL